MTQASPCPLPADAGFLAPPRHLASYTYPGSPSALAVDAAGGVLLLGDTSTRKLLRYSTRRETPQLVGKSLPVNGAFGIALDTNAQRAYVSTADGIVAVDFSGDAARQVGTPVGLRNVEGMAVDPGTGRLYAPEYAEGRLHAYDWTGDALAEAGSPVDVGRRPQQLAIDPSRHRAYVVNVADGTVSVVDISGPPRVSATVAVGRAPYGVAVDPVSHRVFVAGQAEGSVTVIDGCRDPATVVGAPVAAHAAATPNGPVRLALDPVSHRLLVLSPGDNRVVPVDVGLAVPQVMGGGIAVRDGGQGLAVDVASGRVYVGTLDRLEVIDARGDLPLPSASP